MRIHILNLAPVRVGNLRATATVQIGADFHGTFGIWRGEHGDFVQGAQECVQTETGCSPGAPAFAFSDIIRRRVERDLLTAYRMEFDDCAPFVPVGDAASHADNNVGWGLSRERENSGKPKPITTNATNAVQHRSATTAGADDASAQAKSASAGTNVSPNAENESATKKQVEYLCALGYTGAMPANKAAASQMIERLKNEKAEREASERRAQPAMGI